MALLSSKIKLIVLSILCGLDCDRLNLIDLLIDSLIALRVE